jgi:pimeloyl-ACP methyl ester carboxylesterase
LPAPSSAARLQVVVGGADATVRGCAVGYVDVDGHATWVDISGQTGAAAETVVVLHGGMSNSDELLKPIGGALRGMYRVVAFDRRGHGRSADTDTPFHYDDMATETIQVLETVVGGPAHLVGWSDGGIVAMLVALRRADLVNRLVLIGANFHFDGLRHLDFGPDSEVITRIRVAYTERSPDGPEHFRSIVKKSMIMVATEPTLTVDNLARIAAPTLVLVGDDDAIELSHSCALYEALPAGQLAVVPGTSHWVPVEQPTVVGRLITNFLASEPQPRTIMPSRRQHV